MPGQQSEVTHSYATASSLSLIENRVGTGLCLQGEVSHAFATISDFERREQFGESRYCCLCQLNPVGLRPAYTTGGFMVAHVVCEK